MLADLPDGPTIAKAENILHTRALLPPRHGRSSRFEQCPRPSAHDGCRLLCSPSCARQRQGLEPRKRFFTLELTLRAMPNALLFSLLKCIDEAEAMKIDRYRVGGQDIHDGLLFVSES